MTDAISWRNPKVLQVLVLVFVAGALSGAVTYRLGRIFLRPIVVDTAPAPPLTMGGKDTLGMLKRELNLTPAQAGQVAAIIDDYRHYYGNIQDQFDDLRATGKRRVLQVLDAEQRSKFEKLAETLK